MVSPAYGAAPSMPPVKVWRTLNVCACAAGAAMTVAANMTTNASATVPACHLMSKIEAEHCSSPAIVILLDTMLSSPGSRTGWFLDSPTALLLLARSNYCALLSTSQLNFALRRKSFSPDGLSGHVRDCLFEVCGGVTG